MTTAGTPTRTSAPCMRIALGMLVPDNRTPADWPQVRPLVLAYLRAGRVVTQSSALSRDELDPRAPRRVPMGFRTDGAWIWALAVPYYVSKYDMCIDTRFLDAIRERSFIPPHVTPAQVDAALEVLRTVGRALARSGMPPSVPPVRPDARYR